jgi:hypothetical protein
MSGSHIVVVLTNTKGDVEGHRVCDKNKIRWRSHDPQWPCWTFQRAGYWPSSTWFRRTDPKNGGVTLRWPPIYTMVVGSFNVTVALLTTQWSEWLAVSRINDSTLWQRCHATNSLKPLSCTTPLCWPTSQLRRLWPWCMTLCIHKVRHQGKVCTLKLPTSMLSWLRTTVARECYDDYWYVSQSATHLKLRLCVSQKTGGDLKYELMPFLLLPYLGYWLDESQLNSRSCWWYWGTSKLLVFPLLQYPKAVTSIVCSR